jgi:hypothetical protein
LATPMISPRLPCINCVIAPRFTALAFLLAKDGMNFQA